jgi:predicted component of type VI protein secretion system
MCPKVVRRDIVTVLVAVPDARSDLLGCPMPAQLVSLSDSHSILLDKPILLIGRHPECDIPIDSRKISRRHCCIAQVSDYLVVRDLGSTNGIRINGVRVLEGRLRAGDELTIGGHRYQVSWDVLSAAAAGRPDQGMRRKAEHPQAGGSSEDDDLENCDEPVPLAEPAPRPHDLSVHRPAAGLVPPQPRKPEDSPPFIEAPIPRIIPEDLGLAPASDMDMHEPRSP